TAYGAPAVCGPYVPVERITEGHVAERGDGRVEKLPQRGPNYHLGQLPPGHAAAGMERAVRVARYDEPVVGGLYVPVEGVGSRHVAERGGGRRVRGPIPGKRHDLARLGASGAVVGAERAVRVSGYHSVVVQVDSRLVEVFGGAYVREAHHGSG